MLFKRWGRGIKLLRRCADNHQTLTPLSGLGPHTQDLFPQASGQTLTQALLAWRMTPHNRRRNLAWPSPAPILPLMQNVLGPHSPPAFSWPLPLSLIFLLFWGNGSDLMMFVFNDNVLFLCFFSTYFYKNHSKNGHTAKFRRSAFLCHNPMSDFKFDSLLL